MPETLEQRRAAHAYGAVDSFIKSHAPLNDKQERVPDEQAKKYAVHARKLPMRIMASGLGQALAFLVAKRYCPELMKSLAHWCLRKQPHESVDADALLKAVLQGDSETMRRHTAEALAYLRWLVRFVEAADIKGEEE